MFRLLRKTSMTEIVVGLSLCLPSLILLLGVVAPLAVPISGHLVKNTVEKRRARVLKTRPQVRKTSRGDEAAGG
jgi:hypothetical protein